RTAPPVGGVRAAGTPANRDPGNPCTPDTCHPPAGGVHTNPCMPDMSGADMSGGTADMSGGNDLATPLPPDLATGGGSSGCSCDIGGAQESNRSPALLATTLLLGLFGWRLRRRTRR